MNAAVRDFLGANPAGFCVHQTGRRGWRDLKPWAYIVDWYVVGDTLVYWIAGDGGDGGRAHFAEVKTAGIFPADRSDELPSETRTAVAAAGVALGCETSHGLWLLLPIEPCLSLAPEDHRELVDRWRGRGERFVDQGVVHEDDAARSGWYRARAA